MHAQMMMAIRRRDVDGVRANLACASELFGRHDEPLPYIAVKQWAWDLCVAASIQQPTKGKTARFSFDDVHRDILDVLFCEAGLDVNAQSQYTETGVIFLAALIGDVPLIRYLIERGANVNVYDDANNTPMAKAVQYCRVDAMTYLASVTTLRDATDSAVCAAVMSHRPLMIIPAMKCCTLSQINAAVCMCVVNNDCTTLRTLIDNGADPSFVDNDGVTPLHAACMWLAPDCVRELLIIDGVRQTYNRHGYAPVNEALIAAERWGTQIAIHRVCDVLELLMLATPIPPRVNVYTHGRRFSPSVERLQYMYHILFKYANNASTASHARALELACNRPCCPLLVPHMLYRGYGFLGVIREPQFDRMGRIAAWPWTEATHRVAFPLPFRQHQCTLMIVYVVLCRAGFAPFIPLEMWETIMGFTCRTDFPADQTYVAPTELRAIHAYFRQ